MGVSRRSVVVPPYRDITRTILILRGHKVLLDQELATLYGVEIRVLVQAVKRNAERFPEDFMFQLGAEEWSALRSQSVTLEAGRGQHRKYLPYAFTEQGVAMLSSVLRSPRAIAVNIQIMRAFVHMRELLSSNHELAKRLDQLEARLDKKSLASTMQRSPPSSQPSASSCIRGRLSAGRSVSPQISRTRSS